jgi:hypothetical protein
MKIILLFQNLFGLDRTRTDNHGDAKHYTSLQKYKSKTKLKLLDNQVVNLKRWSRFTPSPLGKSLGLISDKD